MNKFPTPPAVRDSANYTCVARNGVGEDRLMHQVFAVTTPSAPVLALAQATHSTLNLTITSGSDGGVPILGKLYCSYEIYATTFIIQTWSYFTVKVCSKPVILQIH